MFASIDVGSNSLRMLIGTVEEGRVLPLHHYRQITRLGGKLSINKGLAPDSMERTLLSLRSFANTLKESEVENIRAVGTQALRRAVNGASFCRQVYHETGISIEILTGRDEAELSAAGALSIFDSEKDSGIDDRLLLDIGGGSTEIVAWAKGQVQKSSSYPLGAVSLMEEVKASEDVIPFDFIKPDLTSIQREFSAYSEKSTLTGTAGTITTIAAYDLAMVTYDWRAINNHKLTISRLNEIYQQLLPMSAVNRETLTGIEKGRGDIIISGLSILIAIMDCLGKNELVVSDFGLLEGVLLKLAD